jgi:4'-phosphopantetheinyl transferase EntD
VATDTLLDGLLPTEIRVAVAQIDDFVDELTPGECESIQRAVASRQHEFSTGRMLARRLLDELGHPRFELLRDDDRVPVWPAGIVGSISHTRNLCMAAAVSGARFLGVGLDVEPDEPVETDIERIVCRNAEKLWVDSAGPEERGRRCRIIFCVKEAVYKAFYPRLREFWSFQDVEVRIDIASGSFVANVPRSTGFECVEGRVVRREGWIVSGISIDA